MHKYRKWIIATLVLLLIAALVWFAGRYTIRLPYFLSGSMEKYLLNIPEGENAKDLILSHCEEISSQVIGETECKQYSCNEEAMQSLLPEDAAMDHVETANSTVYVWYMLPDDTLVTLAYDDSGWNHAIVSHKSPYWSFFYSQDMFKLNSPWVRYIS